MSKSCGRCRRFLSPAEAARCHHCNGVFHLKCVALPSSGSISPSWQCPGCMKSKPKIIIAKDSDVSTPGQKRENPISRNSTINSSFESTHELTLDIAEELNIFRDHLPSVNRDLQTFRDELTEIRLDIKKYQQKVDTLEKKQPLQMEDVDVIAKLRQDLRERDQQLLSNDVEITNFPEVSGENPVNVVLQIAAKIGLTVEERDIDCAERVGGRRIVATDPAGPEARPRPLAVRFTQRAKRDAMLHSARVRRGATSDDLVPGAPRRFYINERLTKTNRDLFRLAREAGKRSGWQFVWVKRGRIFARYKPGDKVNSIRD